ncbi:MAG: hypothetical protein HRU20_01075 [Pseudomonadales bacterium]|nr:hypothetical protein [Pseudomonadales bacterium]
MEAAWSALDLQSPPFYHCVSRAVQRSFQGHEEYQHRCDWIEPRLRLLSENFCIDIASYTVLANNYHLILHINAAKADVLTMTEVIRHWHCIANGTVLSQAYELGRALKIAEIEALQASVDIWRRRLQDISWFMRLLNEAIAEQVGRTSCADFVYAPVEVYPH